MSHTVAEQLQLLGQRGILLTAAKQGEITELCCDAPECLCPEGRHHFEKKTHPPKDWAPSADHFPKLKSEGGKLELGNVRLTHVLCNRFTYTESQGIKNAKDRAKVARLRSRK
jgi:hypothetical protein